MTGSSNDHKVYGSDVLLFNVIPMWILFAAIRVPIGFMFRASRQPSKLVSIIKASASAISSMFNLLQGITIDREQRQ